MISPVFSNSCFRLLLAVFTLLVPACSFGQVKYKGRPIAEIKLTKEYVQYSIKLNQIPSMIQSRQYAEALANVEHSLGFLNRQPKEYLETDMAAAWEYVHFAGPVCQLQLKQYDAAIEGFKKYVQMFPNGKFVVRSIILWADAHAAKEEWETVTKVIPRVLSRENLRRDEAVAARTLLGEAFFRLEKWKEALEPLQWLFFYGTYESRTDVSAMLAICFVRLNDFETLYKFIPAVFKTPARYDVRLQIALLEEGDRHYGEGNTDKALLLFRLIYPKGELIRQLESRVADMKREKEDLKRGDGTDIGKNATAIRRLDRIIEIFAEQLKQIMEIPDYDVDLAIRVANSYQELQRHLEAWLIFRQIHTDYPKHALAQRALYSAFAASLEMKDFDRALRDGHEYMELYPKGEFWDTITVNIATIHLEQLRYDDAIAICELAIKVNPGHALKDNAIYLIGYCHFMQSRLVECLQTMERIFEEHPTSSYLQYGLYYHGLAYLYLQRYTPARQEFAAFLNRFKGGPMVEEVSYRIAVCLFGEASSRPGGDFAPAAIALERFIAKYPESVLISEAYAMLADIQASLGDLDNALANYERAPPMAVNMVQVDYAVMQKSRTLEMEQRWDEVIATWKDYMSRYTEMANFTEALYWIGSAQKSKGDLESALTTFYDGIVAHGDVPAHHGIDMILADLEAELKSLPDKVVMEHINDDELRERTALLRSMKDRLYSEIRKAQQAKHKTLELRLTALFANLAATPQIKDPLVNVLMNERLIPVSGPYALQTMAREARARKIPGLAEKVYDHFLKFHATSDLALDAYKGKADMAFKTKNLPEAVAMLNIITERFPSTEEAGSAYIRLGQVHLARGDFAASTNAFSTVLGVKEWRGAMWPEALYGIGVAHMETGKIKEAHAFFQRVYVMYIGYPDWACKAYLKAAECLTRQGLTSDAVKTLDELLAMTHLATTPEFQEAARMRQNLRGGN